MYINPMLLVDGYKVSHFQQYPKGTELVFSNFTPRKSRLPGIDYAVLFGMKYFIENYLQGFCPKNKNHITELHKDYCNRMISYLGVNSDWPHIRELMELGHLPIAIYSLPELTKIPIGVPAFVIYNTDPKFYWVTNMLETIMSCILWGGSTSATTASAFRNLLDKYAAETSDMPEFVDYQAHDFSFRGMFGLEAALLSGSAHLSYFKGTDSIPAICFNERYYGNSNGCSVAATEHSVTCSNILENGEENKLEAECNFIKRLLTETYPTGIVSYVADSFDFWSVIHYCLPALKDIIMNREGALIIRPDSGDPVDILCGLDDEVRVRYAERIGDRGLIECLWDIFGGTINSKGYKQLDPHIGAIYGDSINLSNCEIILRRLKAKGFASTNVVFGIGSYSYQYVTRDTLGWAMKATYVEINGEGHAIFKDPKTDDGTKKSAKGILKVTKEDGVYKLHQNCTWEQFHQSDNELKLIYKDGVII